MSHNLAVEGLFRELGEGEALVIDEINDQKPYFYFIDIKELEVGRGALID